MPVNSILEQIVNDYIPKDLIGLIDVINIYFKNILDANFFDNF
jgi:hypothetical protein